MRYVATICPAHCRLTFDILTLYIYIGGVRVTCDVANSVPILVYFRLLCSRLWSDVRDRQMSNRQTSDAHHRLMPRPLGAGHDKLKKALDTYRLVYVSILACAYVRHCVPL